MTSETPFVIGLSELGMAPDCTTPVEECSHLIDMKNLVSCTGGSCAFGSGALAGTMCAIIDKFHKARLELTWVHAL